MPRVAVVGAGEAGVEAAVAAAANGARVVLFEAGERIPLPKSSWPSLLDGQERREVSRAEASLASAGVELRFNQRVARVTDDPGVVAGSGKARFEAVVLSTGSSALPERLEGDRKPGVHILNSRPAFYDLGRKLGGYGKAVVHGSGPVAVEVAERLRSRRLAVTVLAQGGLLPMLNPAPRRIVMEALASWGVKVMDARPDKVVGVDRVEAVIASDEVVPGDCFVAIPRRVPAVPEVGAALGRSGGVMVDDGMRSSLKSVFAAGDCAEVGAGSATTSVMFGSSARLMGSVAGSNAAGRRVTASVVGSYLMELTGVGVASAGIGLAESAGLGLDVAELSRSWKGELACSLVYVRSTRAVVGAQVSGKDVGRFAELLPTIVASKLTIDQLAYQETLSTDISPVAETAREGRGVR